jgi:hypothetical protein
VFPLEYRLAVGPLVFLPQLRRVGFRLEYRLVVQGVAFLPQLQRAPVFLP